MTRSKEHLEALLKLPPEERSAAAEVLLVSLEDDEQDPDVEDAWAKEIQRRVAENAPGIPAEQVFAEIRARYQADE